MIANRPVPSACATKGGARPIAQFIAAIDVQGTCNGYQPRNKRGNPVRGSVGENQGGGHRESGSASPILTIAGCHPMVRILDVFLCLP